MNQLLTNDTQTIEYLGPRHSLRVPGLVFWTLESPNITKSAIRLCHGHEAKQCQQIWQKVLTGTDFSSPTTYYIGQAQCGQHPNVLK